MTFWGFEVLLESSELSVQGAGLVPEEGDLLLGGAVLEPLVMGVPNGANHLNGFDFGHG
jgi:hypothetical protein